MFKHAAEIFETYRLISKQMYHFTHCINVSKIID